MAFHRDRAPWCSVVLFVTELLLVAVASPAVSDEFMVKDSKLQAHPGIRIFWLNNDDVLFGGPTGETRQRRDGTAEPVSRVSVWSVRNNAITRYGELAGSLCYYDGYVLFWERDIASDKTWVNYGKLGKTIRQELTPSAGEFDPEICRLTKELPRRPNWANGLAIRWLRPEHGLLILGPADPREAFKNWPIQFCRKGDKASCITTPLNRRESQRFEWIPFKGAYFISGNYFQVVPGHPEGGYNVMPWPAGIDMPIWWLYLDGKTEQMKLPAGHWLQSVVLPTAVGIAALNTYYTTGEAGIYLIRNGEVSKILKGLVHQIAVSPDGCELAVNHDARPLETNARNNDHVTLKVIELCQRR